MPEQISSRPSAVPPLIRAVGVPMSFFMAITAGHQQIHAGPPPMICQDYLMDDCITEASCFDIAEEPTACGGEIGAQCEDEGHVACAYAAPASCQKTNPVIMVCNFD